jgi:pyruvate/2-oxoglutarate dehydrogenase complex dihydrolipoamide dehydrogenase (E3) component
VAGTFDWVSSSRNPRLRLTQLLMKNGADVFQGTGESQDNGKVLVKITDGSRNLQGAVTP